jgi:hypothetical protein
MNPCLQVGQVAMRTLDPPHCTATMHDVLPPVLSLANHSRLEVYVRSVSAKQLSQVLKQAWSLSVPFWQLPSPHVLPTQCLRVQV